MIFSDEAYIKRPTRAEVSIPRLLNNYSVVRSLIGPDVKIMAVVKANAYGHGIRHITEELLSAGADYVGVAYLEEALFLRRQGVTAPILVLGAINTEQISDFILNDVEITTSSLDKSRAISCVATELGRTARVHFKIDTGMERIGVHWYNAASFISETYSLPGIHVAGIFSHLAKAESDKEFTLEQIRRFNVIIKDIKDKGLDPGLIHLANSAAIINYPESHYSMVRPGIMLYGYNPDGNNQHVHFKGKTLQPVMSFRTKVSYFKVCPADTGISYNHRYHTKEETRIVTLPVGYGDGYSRLLSNQGEVVIRGRHYTVAGSVCMDQVMVDIGPDGMAYNGDDVLLFGEMDGVTIPLESLAQKIGTITYEILTNISYRVPRIYLY